ncbi:MAG: hypothetical protein LBM01_02750 [Christensenellaceae bacterium]|jgi:hypothetical protein|nr:hypothetical protein [Christensenellaceae bacterium]
MIIDGTLIQKEIDEIIKDAPDAGFSCNVHCYTEMVGGRPEPSSKKTLLGMICLGRRAIKEQEAKIEGCPDRVDDKICRQNITFMKRANVEERAASRLRGQIERT